MVPKHSKFEPEWFHEVQKENLGLFEWISTEYHDNEGVTCEAQTQGQIVAGLDERQGWWSWTNKEWIDQSKGRTRRAC